MKKKIIFENEYYSISEHVVQNVIPKTAKIFSEIETYLETHEVGGCRYKLMRIDHNQNLKLMDLESREEPDEDLEPDDGFDNFLDDLNCKARSNVRVPYYYYSK